MVSAGNGKHIDEIQEESKTAEDGYGAKNQLPLYTSTSQRGLLDEDKHRNKFLRMVDRVKSIKNGSHGSSSSSSSPYSKFRKISEEKDPISSSAPIHSEQTYGTQFQLPFMKRRISCSSLLEMGKDWIKDPMNMALAVWITCVAISGAILFLVMTGILDDAIPKKSVRNTWFEVNNQILNALFTLMCLYQHPKRFHHLALLYRWSPIDILKLRKIYCKNGSYKPNERKHMMVVVALLHLNCLAQYALCGLNLGYPRSRRPAVGVGLCLSVSIGAPAIASLYAIVSPLGKDYEATGGDEELNDHVTETNRAEKKYSLTPRDNRTVSEAAPEWDGGLFDFWDDISLAYLSVFCSCCVFGWNMDRLGFGNMYVHIATFLLFCLAPFFIFNLAAVNINNETIQEVLGITGFFLCVFGLLYGGFWRIQMRKKFRLPANSFCCGSPMVTDCFQWLCCCSCSLAQEVRTADYYELREDKFYSTQVDLETALSPLPREDGTSLFKSSPSSPYGLSGGYRNAPDEQIRGKNGRMTPPVVFEIERER